MYPHQSYMYTLKIIWYWDQQRQILEGVLFTAALSHRKCTPFLSLTGKVSHPWNSPHVKSLLSSTSLYCSTSHKRPYLSSHLTSSKECTFRLKYEFKRLSLQDGVRSRARSVPGAHWVRSRARSVPWAHRVCSRARSVPWAHRVRSRARSVPWAHRARSVPWAHRVRSRARSVPWAHKVRSRARSVPGAHRVCSRARSVPWAHKVRSRARSVPGAHRVRSRARSVSVSPQSSLQSPLRSGSPQSSLQSLLRSVDRERVKNMY